ncbi:hypothetical protein F1D59_01875 [Streptomyces sp. INR7]|nr:hypothetical protein F1D59_01875 [Streptomyces sp. INR7]
MTPSLSRRRNTKTATGIPTPPSRTPGPPPPPARTRPTRPTRPTARTRPTTPTRRPPSACGPSWKPPPPAVRWRRSPRW